MTCRSCGTSIADKAIVCFRCGVPTADLPSTPRTLATTGGKPWHRILIVFGLSGLGVWLIPLTPPDSWERGAAFVALAAAVFVSVRVSRGRRSGRLRQK
ncbi:MAG: hypothetical protein HQ485_01870 [Acidobacteria bacterium]|nr:hypothetical protein [Acidobacteriota bacterium]